MPQLDLYQVDAFARAPFEGNPAAVVPLERWPSDRLLAAIAAENNLSETAYLVPAGAEWELRWFTPAAEVDLCGHATLAAAHVVLRHLRPGEGRVAFRSPRSGPLAVELRADGLLELDFPARPGERRDVPGELARALETPVIEYWQAPYAMAVLEREADVRALRPDLAALERFGLPVIVTAPGGHCDFVSRFFAPGLGVPEDPVTGSAHCTLVPYWARRLGKRALHARQVSPRGGELLCEDRGDRTSIAGGAVDYLVGTITVPADMGV